MARVTKKTFSAKAPCRIDLSGGTLDIWPLYLNFPEGLVLNQMALSLYASAEVDFAPARDFRLKLYSQDYKRSRSFKSLEELRRALSEPTDKFPLRWLGRVSAYFLENAGWDRGHFELRTESEVPPGSGLGGSSTLGVAMAAAWAKALDKADFFRKDPWLLQKIIRDLESVEIEHPAGEQDYVPALFGGLITFHMAAGLSEVRRHSPKFAKELAKHMALIYTGEPHHSGINNWAVYKAYVDKKKTVRKAFDGIHHTSIRLVESLLRADFEKIAADINEEWKWRQKLGSKVNAPVLKEAAQWAKSQGAIAAKACGSGGGGCLLVMFEDSKARHEFLELQTPQKSWATMPVSCSKEGVLDAL